MFFDKMVKTKEIAIEKANEAYSSLQSEIDKKNQELKEEYDNQLTKEQKESQTSFNNIFITPKQYLDNIYNSIDFKEYLKYALVIKSIDRKMSSIKLGILFIALVLAILIIVVMHPGILSFIIAGILFGGVTILMLKEKTGISYSEYYMDTMSKLLISILPGYRFDEIEKSSNQQNNTVQRNISGYSRYYTTSNILNTDELKKHIDKVFDYYKENNTLLYSCPVAAGGMCDLEIIKKETTVNRETGKEEVRDETIFDGFYIKNKIKDKANLLNDFIIEIREDENFFSSLTEDTAQAIYKSDKNFMFNSEELNKALDCKIKDENAVGKVMDKAAKGIGKMAKNAFNSARGVETEEEDTIVEDSVDPALILEQVMTPALEDRLMYLRKRYNSFNMNLTDAYISFNVNLKKSLFQKYQSKEIFGNKYKKHTESVTFVKPSLYSNDDFEYYRIFPMLEKIFFIHYINLLYRFALKNNDITSVEIDVMENFEKEINEILEGEYSEFKNLYMDDLNEINGMIKETIEEITVNE